MDQRNVAVFIDAENLFKGYGKLDIPDLTMEEMLEQLETAVGREAGAGQIAISRAYADWNALGIEDYRRDVERAGVKTVQVFSAGKASKNAADIELVVDCLRSAADLEQLEVFIIVSADGDFVPLARRLHELDKYVVGATLADHPVNSLLEREVDLYVGIKPTPPPPPASALQPIFSGDGQAVPPPPAAPPRQAESRQAEPRQAESRQAGAEASETKKSPSRRSEPKKQQSKKVSWHAMAQNIGVVHAGPAASPAEYKEIVERVLADPDVSSFCDKLANAGGTLPILAMAIKAAAPEVSPSDARVSSLSRALRFALAGSAYALARTGDDTQPVLVRRADHPDGMLRDLSLKDIERGVQ
ncbi:NYN domain-containing protein [Aeromicrobium sp. CF3.5]|uniref:NYN domain-containing protein n=1 Tax=Aeromicrobium sp. CF3.5 TaxID=3373078 RepID=UPI003EE5E2C7